uniref:Ethylmalonyl-CoA decarboxylase n=1 Tax=Cuerna arida TaxID=1464854 RepID=A0A1B6FY39_9HEMI
MLSTLKNLFKTDSLFGVSVYQGVNHSCDDIALYLSEYTGGSVDIMMDEQSGIATLLLNHPEKKNSITGKMMVDLSNAIKQLESWEAGKGILIYGADNNFCSGGDLNFAQKTGTAEGGYKMATFMQNVLTRLQNLPMVSVAFIEGFAIGGGAELAISCDFRLFSNKDAAMGFVHGRMGIIPAWGGLTTAIQTLGYRTALDLVTTARVVRAAEAEQLGLSDALVSDLSGALDWLAQRTQYDVSVVRAVKCVANNTRQLGSDNLLDFEKRVFSPLWGGPANKLALSQRIKHK